MYSRRALGLCAALLTALGALASGCTCGPAGDAESVVGARASPAQAAFAPPEVVGSPADDRALIAAYREGKLGARLVRDGILVVDPRASADVAEVEVIVLRGSIASPPGEPARLRAAFGVDGRPGRRSTLRGAEPGRPHVLRGVAAGPYTVCAIVSRGASPGDGAAERVAAEVAEARAAGGGEPLSIEAIAAIHARVVDDAAASPGASLAEEVRCVVVEVGRDPASRVIDLARSGDR
ncbi:MAG: hypothetical protein H6711_13135 [Myxococcales bacterium]|nr:hypothetical protein [Myxococcales bacterium]